MRHSLLVSSTTLLLSCAAVEPRPERVHLELTPSQTLVASGAATELTLRLRVRALERPAEPRTPLDLALLLDTSASMEGEAIAQARRAAEALLSAMKDGDSLTLITFDSTAELLVPPTEIDARSRGVIAGRIRGVKAKGSTDLAAAMGLALAQLERRAGPESLHRVVVLSDGIPNDPAPLAGQRARLAQLGASITTFGVGLEYDETLLASLALETGGHFENIEDPAQVARSFEAHVLHLEHLAARSATLELLPGPGVELLGVAGYAGTPIAGRGQQLVLGDLEAGKARELYLHVRVAGHKEGARVELADAVLRFEDPSEATLAPPPARAFVAVESSADVARVAASRDAEVLRGADRASAAAALLESMDLANRGQVAEAEARADAALDAAGAALARDPALAAQVRELRAVREALSSRDRLRTMKRSYSQASQAVH